ncbi:MAG: flagellar protein FlaG [Spirochaetales bacterium]|nr:flagellar protein FlaG [Spirochaetales bacterium]
MSLELPHNIPIKNNSEQANNPIQKDKAIPHFQKNDTPKVVKPIKMEEPYSVKDIENLVNQLEKDIQHFNRRLKFQVNESINRIVVKVIDNETDRVIREVPPEEIQNLIAHIRETIGILYDNEI